MLVRAYEPDQLRAAHRRVYAPPKVDILDSNKGPRAAILDHCQLPHIGLSYGSYTAGVRLQFPETDFASQLFSLAGNSEALINGTPISIHRDRSVVISPRETLNVINNAGYRRLVASPAGERIFRGKLGASDCRGDLADLTGASALSLSRSFNRDRGCLPIEFAYRLRLGHVRMPLLRPNGNTTVANVASSCGFGDLRQFMRIEAFGERPSQTLLRGRRTRPCGGGLWCPAQFTARFYSSAPCGSWRRDKTIAT